MIVHFAVGPPRQRQPEQLHPRCRGREVLVGLEGGLRRGDEEKPGQTQFLDGRLRQQQMPGVNWVK